MCGVLAHTLFEFYLYHPSHRLLDFNKQCKKLCIKIIQIFSKIRTLIRVWVWSRSHTPGMVTRECAVSHQRSGTWKVTCLLGFRFFVAWPAHLHLSSFFEMSLKYISTFSLRLARFCLRAVALEGNGQVFDT